MVYPYPTDKIYICGPGWQNPQFSDFCQLLCLIHYHCKSPTSLVLQLRGTFSAPQSYCSLFLSHFQAISHPSPSSPDSYNSVVSTSLSSECLVWVIKIKLGFLVCVCYGTLSPISMWSGNTLHLYCTFNCLHFSGYKVHKDRHYMDV